jgi:tetratricopeptide (TPR) repeat protein
VAELARGTVADRPWGRTLAALGLRGLTGQLTLTAEGKRYQLAFGEGAVVGAGSPLASDAAARIALTGSLISSTQVGDIARKLAAAPGRDEVDVIAELARLGPEQAIRLRRRVVAQRAARSFAVDRGEFVVEDAITVPVVAGSELDIRAVIYLGARSFLSENRLNTELGQLGQWFQLKPEAVEDLRQFGFTDAERPVIEALRGGAGLAALETPDREQRMVRAVVYALASCGAVTCESGLRAPDRKPPARPAPRRAPDSIDPPTTVSPAAAAADLDPQTTLRRSEVDAPTRRRPTAQAPAQRKAADEQQTAAVQALISARLELLESGGDRFQLLGVGREAPAEQIRIAYFGLARQLHPDRLASLGIDDTERRAQRLFAEVNTAFSILSDPARRAEYLGVLRRGGEAAVRQEQADAEAMAMRVLESEEAFRRGEMALRRDQMSTAIRELEHAIELNPDEVDYHAALAWARFCLASDKLAVATATRKALEEALAKAPRSVSARFYLGRVERILGRDEDALRHFKQVLERVPHHAEAMSEVRVLESRLAAGADKGLFGRPKR